ncbi:NADPH-dependent glutamate synthase [Enteroscipio rubneri]|uniref:NADPH-dependent glutamate synthase n=1 Tax=Enteroscipio rubneri TaxID=2070686 RepID=UPI0032095E5C
MARLSYEPNKQKEKTPMPELDPVERAQTFEEVALGYSAEEAVNEARRCTQCPSKPCMAGCPVGVPIPSFIEQVALGNFARAYALVKSANSLPAICGRVCPQESQCEKRCTRGKQGEPVGIGRLERFTSDWAFEHPEEAAIAIEELREQRAAGAADASLQTDAGASSSDDAAMDDANAVFPDVDLSGKSVAVVGSGPASLTCAGELAKRGCSVTMFEALHKLGGVLTYGIPEFRLPKDLVARETSKLGDLGVTFAVNSVVGKLYDIDELLEERGFDAVFVGTGAGLPSYLNIEGEGLNGVSVASELLTRVNLMKAYRFPAYDTPVYAGKKCVVVGGGNVAMDAARTARRLGADVCVVYRRGREEMPARAEEIHHAEQEGIEFKLLTNPTRILGDENGWVSGVECVRMELGEPDASGRRRPKPVEGSEFVIDIDMLVIAAGSKTNPLIANTTPGLDVTTRSLIVADERTCATSKPGVFAGGDAVIGAATVILAMGAGKRAAAGIAEYLAPSA